MFFIMSTSFLSSSVEFAQEMMKMDSVIFWEYVNKAIPVQIMDETVCISHCANILGNGMNPTILPPAMIK